MTFARITQVALLLAGTLAGLRAQSPNFTVTCSGMLKPVFDFAALGGGYHYPVYATVTKQSASQSTSQTYDPVHYANGEVIFHPAPIILGAQSFLQADLPLLSNSSNFASKPAYTMLVYLRQDGYVGIQEKINGNALGGMPPTYFQGSCSGGLVTGVVGSTSYTVSLTTSQPVYIPK